jgi:hypothetical protein
MKKNQLILLTIACLAVGVACWLVREKKEDAWAGGSGSGKSDGAAATKVFADFPVDDIRRLVITAPQGSAEIALVDQKWVVKSHHGYPANFDKVATLVRNIYKLEPLQKIAVGKNDYGKLELLDPEDAKAKADDTLAGIRVDFYSEDGSRVSQVLLGKEHLKAADPSAQPNPFGMGGGGWPDGRYIMDPANGDVVLVGETFSNVNDDSLTWLDKDFIKVEDIRTAVASDGEVEVWRLERTSKGGTLELAGDMPEGKEPDTTKIGNVDSSLRYANFKSVAGPADAAAGDGEQAAPVRTYRATTFDGAVYTLTIGAKTEAGDFPVSVTVAFELPAPPAPPEDETPEAREKREKEYAEKIDEAKKKARADNKRFGAWSYIVASYIVDDLVVGRDALLKDVEKPEADDSEDSGAEATVPLPPEAAGE